VRKRARHFPQMISFHPISAIVTFSHNPKSMGVILTGRTQLSITLVSQVISRHSLFIASSSSSKLSKYIFSNISLDFQAFCCSFFRFSRSLRKALLLLLWVHPRKIRISSVKQDGQEMSSSLYIIPPLFLVFFRKIECTSAGTPNRPAKEPL